MFSTDKVSIFLWHFIKRQRVAFFFIFFTAMVWSLNEMLFPYFLKIIVNTVAGFKADRHEIYAALFKPLLALVVLWCCMETSMRVQGFIVMHTFPKFRANIRQSVLQYIKQHSYEYFLNNFAGSIAKKLNEVPNSSQTVMEIFCFNFVSIMVALVIALGLMIHAKPLFAAIIFIWFCAHMGITLAFLRYTHLKWEEHAESTSTLSGKIIDSITNIITIRLFARGNYEREYVQSYQTEETNKAKKAMWATEMMRLCQGFCGLALIFTVVFTLIHGWIQGWVTLGDFTLIGMLTFWLMGMVWYMSFQLATFVREIGVIKEALSLIHVQHDVVDKPAAKPLVITKGEIEFVNVSFAYRNNQSVFNQLNVTIKPGQKVGLVGFSGAGKTTFANLILRLYDIQNGEILIDGQSIANVTQDSLRELIAMIPQEPTLFHRSLLENIRYGRLDATEEEVIAAAKQAHCDEFISRLPEGYHTLVGERGIKLSGGQRQRIAIARAILKNALVLILDEATSALDSVTEKLIQESFATLMRNRTTLVIAHRLSTLASMDRILVFHQGKIIEDGSKEELLAMNGYFAKLWRMQMDGFLPEEEIAVN